MTLTELQSRIRREMMIKETKKERMRREIWEEKKDEYSTYEYFLIDFERIYKRLKKVMAGEELSK